ncbi:MAG: hypothetical protein U5J63_07350 [Fodinibius sp.]|nr:hypothetical protein [Fodinibius sp.]
MKLATTLMLLEFQKEKGFTGVMKRHNFQWGRRSNTTASTTGNAIPGSIGQASDPARISRYARWLDVSGNERTKIKNLTM